MSASIVATTLTTPDTTRSYTVTINGADISGDVVQDSLTMEDQGAGTQGTTSFLVANSQLTLSKLADQGLVTIEDHISGNLAFRGFVDSRSPSRLPEWNQIEIVASDHTSLLDNVIPYELRPAGENDQARIGYLWGLYAGSYLQGALTYVQQVSASLPAQQFAGVTIRQALDMIAAQASTTATWYLDRAGMLHYFATETNNAPKNVTSDTPGGGEVAPMDLAIDSDSKAYVSRVYVRGKTDEGSGWVTSDVARAATNDLIRSAFLDAPDSTTSTMRDAIGNAYLARAGASIKRGTFSVTSADADGWRAGQNVTVRTTHLGSLNAAYRIARVRTTVLGPYNSRPSGLRKYEVEFGSASVASSAGTGPVVGTGIVGDLLDDGGNTLLAAGTSGVVSGLGGAIRRYITSGVYNSDFSQAPPYADSTIVNSYNPLPYWSFVSSSGTSISCTSLTNSSTASGRVIQFQMDAGGGAGDSAYIEQIVPINGALGRSFQVAAYATFKTGPTVSAAICWMTTEFLRNDGATVTGSGESFGNTTTGTGANTLMADLGRTSNLNTPPSDAYYMRVRVGFKRDVAATTVAETVTLTEVICVAGPYRTLTPDMTAPSSYGPTRWYQNNGQLFIQANANALGGVGPATLTLFGDSASPGIGSNGYVRVPSGSLVRYVPLLSSYIQAVTDASTTAAAIAETAVAEMTALPSTGVVAVTAVLIISCDTPDTGNRLDVYDYGHSGGGASVLSVYGTGTAGYAAAGQAIVATGGTNNRQIKYSVARGAGTVTYYLRVLGYWTTI